MALAKGRTAQLQAALGKEAAKLVKESHLGPGDRNPWDIRRRFLGIRGTADPHRRELPQIPKGKSVLEPMARGWPDDGNRPRRAP